MDSGAAIHNFFWKMRGLRAPQFPAAPAGKFHLTLPGTPGW
jgi:hypothetical protein